MPREAPVMRAILPERGPAISTYGAVVMPALVAGIHVLSSCMQDVDGRDKPGHDGGMW